MSTLVGAFLFFVGNVIDRIVLSWLVKYVDV